MPVKVFISYAHKDESFKDSLNEHLVMLQRSGVISSWHDRELIPGDNWKDEISSHLEEAELILFLVSSSFLASQYCFEVEFARALAKHSEGSAQLIPIIVRSCDWKSSKLGPFQGLPKDAEPIVKWSDSDDAWLNVVEGIKKRLAAFAPKSVPDSAVATLPEKKKL